MSLPHLQSTLCPYSQTAAQLVGRRMVLFSYGSGLASSMYSLRASQDASPGSRLEALVSSLADVRHRLASRGKADPAKFEEIMKLREETHHIGSCLDLLRVSIQVLSVRWFGAGYHGFAPFSPWALFKIRVAMN